MDSKKNQRLSLEARHTKSLEASKEVRLKFEQSMFMPREHYSRNTANELKKTDSKKENLQDQDFNTPPNCKNVKSPKIQLKEKYLKKTPPPYAKSSKKLENSNDKKFFPTTSKSPEIKTLNLFSTAAVEHSNKRMSFESQTTYSNTKNSQNNSNAEDTATSDSEKLQIMANEISPDSALPAPPPTKKNSFTIESLLNLSEAVKTSSIDHSNASSPKASDELNFNHFCVDYINKISQVQQTPTDESNSKQCMKSSCLEKAAACHQVKSKSKALCKSDDDDKASNSTNKETENPPAEAKEKLKDNDAFGSLFEADFQNIIRYSITPANDYSSIDRLIRNDLWTLDNCAKSFSKCIWKIHKDLDDKEMETQKRVEYARKKDTERENWPQPNGFNHSKATEQTVKTFTIFIEAAGLPKKSITFETSDIFHAKARNANNDSNHDMRFSTRKSASEPRNPNKNKNPQYHKPYFNRKAATKYPVRPSSKILSQNRTNNQETKNPILQPAAKKVKPIKPIPLNVAVQNRTPPSTAANYFNDHFTYDTPNQVYDNYCNTPNYYNYWPEENLCSSSWIAAREEWRKKSNFNSPTIEVANWSPPLYQCTSSHQLPPATFMQNPYLQPLIESSTCHNRMPHFMTTYQQDIQLAKY